MESFSFVSANRSQIIKLLLVRWDVILWITGLLTHEIHDPPMNNDDSIVEVSKFWSLLILGFFYQQVRGSRGAIQQSGFTARGSRAHPTTPGLHCWERGQDETTHRKLMSRCIPTYSKICIKMDVNKRSFDLSFKDEKRYYQLELVNRETNFNKVFNNNTNVGVINPLAKVGISVCSSECAELPDVSSTFLQH